MNTISFNYLLTPEKKGFSVVCLDWDSVYSQGESFDECKNNVAEVTEMFLKDLLEKKLSKKQYPSIKKHLADPYTFQLTFDLNKAKYIPENKIPFNQK